MATLNDGIQLSVSNHVMVLVILSLDIKATSLFKNGIVC